MTTLMLTPFLLPFTVLLKRDWWQGFFFLIAFTCELNSGRFFFRCSFNAIIRIIMSGLFRWTRVTFLDDDVEQNLYLWQRVIWSVLPLRRKVCYLQKKRQFSIFTEGHCIHMRKQSFPFNIEINSLNFSLLIHASMWESGKEAESSIWVFMIDSHILESMLTLFLSCRG